MIKILATMCLVLAASVASARPVIVSAAGRTNNSESITITGTGFGTKSPATPWFFDRVSTTLKTESGGAYSDSSYYGGLSDGDDIPVGAGYPWPEKEGDPVYESNDSKLRVAGRPAYRAGPDVMGSVVSALGYPYDDNSETELYVDWWVYSEELNTHPKGFQSKMLRIWNEPAKKNGHISMYRAYVSYDRGIDATCYPLDGKGATSQTRMYNQDFVWSHLSTYTNTSGYMSDDCNSTGIMKGWTSSPVMYFQPIYIDELGWKTDVYPLQPGAGNYTFLQSIGAESAGDLIHMGLSTNMWMDIYADNTLARVILANDSNLSSVTHYEMQIPTAWNTTNITFEVNLGAFDVGEEVFIFVFDSDGLTCLDGYPLIVGAPAGVTDPCE